MEKGWYLDVSIIGFLDREGFKTFVDTVEGDVNVFWGSSACEEVTETTSSDTPWC
jgi:hypothetical protein